MYVISSRTYHEYRHPKNGACVDEVEERVQLDLTNFSMKRI
jgi:hypothetical protein